MEAPEEKKHLIDYSPINCPSGPGTHTTKFTVDTTGEVSYLKEHFEIINKKNVEKDLDEESK
jgi:hypothetical protein